MPTGGVCGAGRYAPSPSGDLHLGNLRTALLAWAYARKSGRKFLLRIEDLDERSRPEHEASQLRDLEALGIDWDEEPLRQSERLDVYADVCGDLSRRGLLYECYCTRKELADVVRAPHQAPGAYTGTCRDITETERAEKRHKMAELRRAPAMRLCSNNDQGFAVADAHYGRYVGAVDDLVIRRGDGVYSYNFVSVVDDALSGIDQIVRGSDLLPSTPRQVYLQELLGYETPEYRHVPLVLNGRGVRLAKRDGAVTMERLAEYGWESGDIVQLLAASLGYGVSGLMSEKPMGETSISEKFCEPIRSAQDFLDVFNVERLSSVDDSVREPWLFDPRAVGDVDLAQMRG